MGVEFSHNFEVLRVGENHPFSFNGLAHWPTISGVVVSPMVNHSSFDGLKM